jgi:DNA-nicking Smr family endonuclease
VGRKNKNSRGGGLGDGGEKPRVDIDVSADADQQFLEAMAREAGPLVDKDQQLDAARALEDAAQRAKSSGVGGGAGEAGGGGKTVDLHGCSLAEAQDKVDNAFSTIFKTLGSTPVVLTIVTGKGRHSGPGGAVLPREIHSYVRSRYKPYIVRIEDSPADVVIGDLPVRGHFRVWFARR